MDHLNSPDFNPELAQKRIRIFAILVDYVIFFIIFYLIAVIFGEKEYTREGYSYVITNPIAKLTLFLFWIVLFPILEGLTGQTIGKLIFKIKVVKQDYSEAGLGHSIARHFLDFIDGFLFGLLGVLVASNTKLKQRIGDLVARTIVISSLKTGA